MKFVNWEWRPAVVLASGAAFAVVTPGGGWLRVDSSDVAESGAVLSEAVWRATFEAKFGGLDLSTIPAPARAIAAE